MVATYTPYQTARTFVDSLPSWMSVEDGERISAYTVYEMMYKNIPETFALMMRGTEDKPIYVPSTRAMIEAKNRFVAQHWNYFVDPAVGTSGDQEAVGMMLKSLFRREEMYAKFNTNRRWGLIRGDSLWHIVADDTKPETQRVSIYEVDPSSYFPIPDPNDDTKIIGVHLVDQMVNDDDEVIIRRHTYRKDPEAGGQIFTQLAFFELDAWDDRWGSTQTLTKATPPGTLSEAQKLLMTGFYLDARITSLPIYHVKNRRETNNPFGVSEIQGMERVYSGINQLISDTELGHSLDGIGVYVTTSSPPIDATTGEEQPWRIKPGGVLEIDPEADWKRVNGVHDVPGLQIADWLTDASQVAAGVPDIALGAVDVHIAESGIALALKMAPMLKQAEDQEQVILDVMDHLMWDLTHMWLPVYEGTPDQVDVLTTVQDPMPVDKQAEFDRIITLYKEGLVTGDWAREKLGELGFEGLENMGAAVIEETAAKAAATDPLAARTDVELAGGTGNDAGVPSTNGSVPEGVPVA